MRPIQDHLDAINYHGNRPDIEPLPVVRCHVDGTPVLTSCWRLSWRDRLALLIRGRLWLQIMGTAQPPIAFATSAPYLETNA
ncbi:MAG TPA: hypothetical protein VNM48_07935 [Chloroflexota bacterium]|nr:hypothetical protein [Chloroflexota bacterium]